MTQEQKAKAYDEAIERAKAFNKRWQGVQAIDSELALKELKEIFTEFKESEDERIRKEIISALKYANHKGVYDKHIAWLEKQGNKDTQVIPTFTFDDILALQCCMETVKKVQEDKDLYEKLNDLHGRVYDAYHLEKQGENSFVNFNEAEQEKYDFVSGQYIECRASFNEFKEDNSYWFEYIGGDTYIGRSDNILNKKFHITPRQLFTLFTQQHFSKEDNTNEETNAPTGYGKYVDECLNEASKYFFSSGEDAYSVADLFYAGVRCGKSWFENQAEQKPIVVIPKFRIGDTMRTKQEATDGITGGMPVVVSIDNEYYHCTNELIAIKDQDDYEFPPINVKQKPTDKVEPKFKPGDWVVYYRNDHSREVLQIYDIRDDRYYFTDNVHFSWSVKECDEKSHLWTIKDAKSGDILFHSDSASNGIFIFKELLKYEFSEKVICYCDYDSEDHFCLGEHHTCCWTDAKILHPATKKQCDILFQKMKEAGYEWDANKKQLKKNEQKLAGEKESLLKDLEWVDMETNECHCYNCELFDDENNVCKCIDLCKRPKSTYKGFYEVMKTEIK